MYQGVFSSTDFHISKRKFQNYISFASLDLPIMAVLTWQMWLSVNVEGRIRGELPPVNHYANLFFTNILEILFNAVISGSQAKACVLATCTCTCNAGVILYLQVCVHLYL